MKERNSQTKAGKKQTNKQTGHQSQTKGKPTKQTKLERKKTTINIARQKKRNKKAR